MKKFIALFLVFSILAISSNLYAKERRGADLVITKKDSQQVKGELIAVKENSLLLLDSESGADISIDIADIRIIRIVKKGALYGLLVGGGIGLIAGIDNKEDPFLDSFLGCIILVGLPVALIVGRDKTIQIEGMTDSEIREAMDKLSKKARIRDYK